MSTSGSPTSPDRSSGWPATGVITIDQDAAGYGWFIDPTPADDSEFGGVAQSPARVASTSCRSSPTSWGTSLDWTTTMETM